MQSSRCDSCSDSILDSSTSSDRDRKLKHKFKLLEKNKFQKLTFWWKNIVHRYLVVV